MTGMGMNVGTSLRPSQRSARATARMTTSALRAHRVEGAATDKSTGREQLANPTERRSILLSALAISIGAPLALRPRAAHAGLFGPPPTNKASGAADKYKEMMKQMDKQNAGGGGLSAESMYNESGGACGVGYKLKVEKVLGSSCICVDEAACGEGSEGERKDISATERSFGG